MVRIQYGIAGFFTGAFLGLLIALIERRLIDADTYPTIQFVAIALTVIFCGIFGIAQALKIEKNKRLKR
ncbi:MAG: hypothetical protein H7258_04890 [Ferruginibacter sp.]|nr:hypothetical protein [Ferruginibacter sp.]